MARKEYLELLRDPRWQKRRLQVLAAADWMCRNCYDDKKTLNVHHRWYERGKMPWEYGDDCLVSLCEDCHSAATVDQAELKAVIRSLPEGRLRMAIGAIRALASDDMEPGFKITVREYADAMGVGLIYRCDSNDVATLAIKSGDGTVTVGDLAGIRKT